MMTHNIKLKDIASFYIILEEHKTALINATSSILTAIDEFRKNNKGQTIDSIDNFICYNFCFTILMITKSIEELQITLNKLAEEISTKDNDKEFFVYAHYINDKQEYTTNFKNDLIEQFGKFTEAINKMNESISIPSPCESLPANDYIITSFENQETYLIDVHTFFNNLNDNYSIKIEENLLVIGELIQLFDKVATFDVTNYDESQLPKLVAYNYPHIMNNINNLIDFTNTTRLTESEVTGLGPTVRIIKGQRQVGGALTRIGVMALDLAVTAFISPVELTYKIPIYTCKVVLDLNTLHRGISEMNLGRNGDITSNAEGFLDMAVRQIPNQTIQNFYFLNYNNMYSFLEITTNLIDFGISGYSLLKVGNGFIHSSSKSIYIKELLGFDVSSVRDILKFDKNSFKTIGKISGKSLILFDTFTGCIRNQMSNCLDNFLKNFISEEAVDNFLKFTNTLPILTKQEIKYIINKSINKLNGLNFEESDVTIYNFNDIETFEKGLINKQYSVSDSITKNKDAEKTFLYLLDQAGGRIDFENLSQSDLQNIRQGKNLKSIPIITPNNKRIVVEIHGTTKNRIVKKPIDPNATPITIELNNEFIIKSRGYKTQIQEKINTVRESGVNVIDNAKIIFFNNVDSDTDINEYYDEEYVLNLFQKYGNKN